MTRKPPLGGKLILAVVAVLGAIGSSTLAESAPVRSLSEMRRDGVVVQEYDLSCAAAAVATLLSYQHGDPVSEIEIVRGLIRRPEYLASPELVRLRQGFSLLDLKRFVEGRGYSGTGLGNLELADLDALAPVIVPVRLHGYNHFVVYRGSRGDRVLLADPAYGNRTLQIDRFQSAWIDAPEFGRVGFTVERRDGLEPPNRLAPRPEEFVM